MSDAPCGALLHELTHLLGVICWNFTTRCPFILKENHVLQRNTQSEGKDGHFTESKHDLIGGLGFEA